LRNNFQGVFKIHAGTCPAVLRFCAGSLDVGDAPTSITLNKLPFFSTNIVGKTTYEMGGYTTSVFPFLLQVSWVKHPVSWWDKQLVFTHFFCDFSWVKQPVSWGGETTCIFPFLLRDIRE